MIRDLGITKKPNTYFDTVIIGPSFKEKLRKCLYSLYENNYVSNYSAVCSVSNSGVKLRGLRVLENQKRAVYAIWAKLKTCTRLNSYLRYCTSLSIVVNRLTAIFPANGSPSTSLVFPSEFSSGRHRIVGTFFSYLSQRSLSLM